MKKVVYILLCLAFLGCSKEEPCATSIGKITLEEQPISPTLSQIVLEDDILLDVVHDTLQFKAIIETGSNLQSGIMLTENGEQLTLQNGAKCKWLRDLSHRPKVTLYLDTRLISNITHYGSENINAQILSSEFTYESWSSAGQLNYTGANEACYFKLHAGPGDILAQGQTKYLYLYNGAIGKINTEAMQAETGLVVSNTIASCKVNVSEELKITFQENNSKVLYNSTVKNLIIEGNGKALPY